MPLNLLEYTAKELLDKFGAGNHKPGSGSAAAFHGMLSAKLIQTVIFLSTEEKRRREYGVYFSEFYDRDKEITNRIYPRLEKLFEEDSIQFDKAIKSREERDAEENPIKKSELIRKALDELKIATEIPIEIAELCRDLARISAFLFDHGFQSARGDSCVGLNTAVSSLGGCLSIIELNLLSFGSDDWTLKIRQKNEELRVEHEALQAKAVECLNSLREESMRKHLYHKEVNELLAVTKAKSSFSNADLEETAIQLQDIIWEYQDVVWKRDKPKDLLGILKPEVFFRKGLGYQFYKPKTLGKNEALGDNYEIAGIINQKDRIVEISGLFTPDQQNFTAAHELGHAILHKQMILHRDKVLDGTSTNSKNAQEYEADKFAAYFLMPSHAVKKVFESHFLTSRFKIDDNNAFRLINNGPSALRTRCKDLRGLSRLLATTEGFGSGRNFISIAKLFNVSAGAMAIRLEELGLVEF